jgi:uncharacterized protein
MTESGALAVVQQAWDCWVAGDLDGFLAVWDGDGVWTMPGNSQLSGQWRGLEQIRKVAEIAFEVSGGTLEARPIEVVSAGDESVLGYFHFTASRPDASLDQDALQRWVVRGAKVVSMQNMFADVAAVDAFYR